LADHFLLCACGQSNVLIDPYLRVGK
jgi:hypothetical protein